MIEVAIEVTVDGYSFKVDKRIATMYRGEPNISQAIEVFDKEVERLKKAMRGME